MLRPPESAEASVKSSPSHSEAAGLARTSRRLTKADVDETLRLLVEATPRRRSRIRARASAVTFEEISLEGESEISSFSDGSSSEGESTRQGSRRDRSLLVSPWEIEIARRDVWKPDGEWLPSVSDINMTYQSAYDIGQKGSYVLVVKSIWTIPWLSPSTLKFSKMDATDPERFLSFFTKSDEAVSLGDVPRPAGCISIDEMRDGYWNYADKRVRTKSQARGSGPVHIQGFAAEFFDALLVAIREYETRKCVSALRERRLAARARAQVHR